MGRKSLFLLFCGFPLKADGGCAARHVAKTGDIKEFVITEESGIAKGIRRIIAVTGPEAREAIALAAEFERRLEDVKKLSGKEKEETLKYFGLVS